MVSAKNLLLGSIPILAGSLSLAAPTDGKRLKRGLQPPKLDFQVYRGEDPLKALFAKRDDKVQWPVNRGPTFYLANVALGSDQEQIFVILDTGSSDLWVLESDADCVNVGAVKRDNTGQTGVGYVYDDDGELLYSTFFNSFPALTEFTTIYTTQVMTQYTTKTILYTAGQSSEETSAAPGSSFGTTIASTDSAAESVTASVVPNYPIYTQDGETYTLTAGVLIPSSAGATPGSIIYDFDGTEYTVGPGLVIPATSATASQSKSASASFSYSAVPNYPIYTQDGETYTLTAGVLIPSSAGATPGSIIYDFDGTEYTVGPGLVIPATSANTSQSKSASATESVTASVVPNYPIYTQDGETYTLTAGVLIPSSAGATPGSIIYDFDGTEYTVGPGLVIPTSSKRNSSRVETGYPNTSYNDITYPSSTASSTDDLLYTLDGTTYSLTPGLVIPAPSTTASYWTGTSLAPNYPLFSVDGGYVTLSPGVLIPGGTSSVSGSSKITLSSASTSVTSNVYPLYTLGGTVYTVSPGLAIPTATSTPSNSNSSYTVLPNYPLYSVDGEYYTLSPGVLIPKSGPTSSGAVTMSGVNATTTSNLDSSTASSYYVYSVDGTQITLSPGAQIPSSKTSPRNTSFTGPTIAPNYPLFSVDGGYITLTPGAVIPTPTGSLGVSVNSSSSVTTSSSHSASLTSSFVMLAEKNNTATSSEVEQSTLVDTPQSESTVLNDGCLSYGSFNPNNSDTFKPNTSTPEFLISYYDNSSASGIWARDDVTLGGITVKDLSFGLVNKTSSTLGVFGIGLAATEVADKQYDNYPILLKRQGYINKVAYSVYLNSDSAYQGSVLFGAVDHAKYSGKLTTVPMTKDSSTGAPSKMEIPISSWILSLNTKNLSLATSKHSALLDTGTTITYVPTDLFKTITQQLSANYSSDLAAYAVDCSVGLQNFVISFGQTHIKVPVQHFILESDGSCTLDIQAQAGDYITFGDNFLRATYLVYDLEDYTISVAQANYTDDEDIEIINDKIPGASSVDNSASYASASAASGPSSEATSLVNAPLIKRSSGAPALQLSMITFFMGLVISILPFIRG